MRLRTWFAAAASFVLVAACTATTPGASPGGQTQPPAGQTQAPGQTQSPTQMLIIGVFHIDTARPFAATVATGIKAAEKDFAAYGVRTEFLGPPTFDLVQVGQIIDAAIAKKPAGLFLTIPDVNAIGPKIKAARAAGIPVVTYNSGIKVFRETGSLAHVGQDEMPAGLAAGQRLVTLGARNVLCFNHQVGNIALDDRCAGIAEAMKRAGGKSTVVVTNQSDPAGTEGAILAAFRRDPTIDGIGGGFGGGIEVDLVPKVLAQVGMTGKVKVGFFDTSTNALNKIKAGQLDFVISQQGYLQGYLPVMMLVMYNRLGLVPGGATGVIETGPFFVDKTNVDQMIKLVQEKAF